MNIVSIIIVLLVFAYTALRYLQKSQVRCESLAKDSVPLFLQFVKNYVLLMKIKIC